ncbi:hypothetical protein SCA6_019520 [Theobroma cacao]
MSIFMALAFHSMKLSNEQRVLIPKRGGFLIRSHECHWPLPRPFQVSISISSVFLTLSLKLR